MPPLNYIFLIFIWHIGLKSTLDNEVKLNRNSFQNQDTERPILGVRLILKICDRFVLILKDLYWYWKICIDVERWILILTVTMMMLHKYVIDEAVDFWTKSFNTFFVAPFSNFPIFSPNHEDWWQQWFCRLSMPMINCNATTLPRKLTQKDCKWQFH